MPDQTAVVKLSTSSADVVVWLESLSRTRANPVTVKIGRTTYVGAEYWQTRDHSPGTRAYADGKRTYVQHALYLLGKLPRSFVNGSARAGYVESDGSGACWYVAGFYPLEQDDRVNDYHPFGAMFQLHPGTPTNRYGEAYASAPMTMVVERS